MPVLVGPEMERNNLILWVAWFQADRLIKNYLGREKVEAGADHPENYTFWKNVNPGPIFFNLLKRLFYDIQIKVFNNGFMSH